MAVWVTRAGGRGEHESRFLGDGRTYATWQSASADLREFVDKKALRDKLAELYPSESVKQIQNSAGQLWAFSHDINTGDLVVLPSKSHSGIYVGRIKSPYQFDATASDPYFHWHAVAWREESIAREAFGKDLLFSFGGQLTIFRVQRNNAEARLNAMEASGWKPERDVPTSKSLNEMDVEAAPDPDLEEEARYQIIREISARFAGHDMAILVEGILKAQGYSTHRSPPGPDGGVDILAGSGPLGFGSPRLCVQVKSQESQIDSTEVTKLKGTMDTVQANEGLFVAWGGYRTSVKIAANFFKVRLWTQRDLLEAVFANYDKFDEDLKARLPLKRVWTLARENDI